MIDRETRELEVTALEYLREQLGERAPKSLTLAGSFEEEPLPGEGAVKLFIFDIEPSNAVATCAAGDRRHFVVVGATQPNYSPLFGMNSDDAYSLHIGTRFLLEVGVEKLAIEDEPAPFRAHMEHFVRGCNPAAEIGAAECVLLFRCDEQQFAVYRLEIARRPAYFIGGDLPPGFYELTEHPPQVALRLHLGKLIRAEDAG